MKTNFIGNITKYQRENAQKMKNLLYKVSKAFELYYKFKRVEC